ncbi:MAG: MFS transporter [Alphaproteobacteria bacterium]|nr:MFS transporter [Alphaproteobacteria bacterium]
MPVGLVALCFSLGFAVRGVSESFGVFVPSLEAGFAADRAAITGIYGLSMLCAGFGGPLVGLVLDRTGPRTLIMAGIVCAGGGALLASRAQTVWQLYATLGFGIGVASAALGSVVFAALLGRWFTARLGTALAVVWSASSVGVMLVSPVAQALIAAQGWRFAYVCMGLGVLALAFPAAILPWRRIAAGDPAIAAAHRKGQALPAGPTIAMALRDPPFWALTFAFAMTSASVFGIAPQINAYLIETGLTPAAAARVWALNAMLTPIGMIGFNWLADRGGRVLGAVTAYAGTGLGLVALWSLRGPDDIWLIAAFILLFGGTMGSRGPMISTLATLRYRGAHVGRIYGLITCGMGAGGALGAWLGGLVHDLSGGYRGCFILSLIALVLAAVPLAFEARARERM